MSTTLVAPKESNRKAIGLADVPQVEIDQMIRLDQMVTEFRHRLADPELGSMPKILIQAKAIASLEAAITPAMMTDVMKLQNSPLGFLTDRKEGYDQTTVKRCMIVAWLAGANMTGNEMNIIAGNCYLTKKFTLPKILKTRGLKYLAIEIGAPMKHGEKTAVCDARASWLMEGEKCSVECAKTENFDGRIVVNCYSSSGPDEIRGKVEAKLYQRVWQRITGMNIEPGDDADSTNTVDAVATRQADAKANPNVIEDRRDPPDEETARNIVQSFRDQVEGMTMKNDVRRSLDHSERLVDTAEWDDMMKQQTKLALQEIASDRCEAIGASRGQNPGR